MDEEDIVGRTKAEAEKLRLRAMEDSLLLSNHDKLESLDRNFSKVLEGIQVVMASAPSYLILAYNQSYRIGLEEALAEGALEDKVIISDKIFRRLLVEPSRIEDALLSGDGDFDKFTKYLSEVALCSQAAHGVLEALQLEWGLEE